MPEYTISLLIWIAPIIFFVLFLRIKKLLTVKKRRALLITVVVLASVGILLDLLFARYFFRFPDKTMVLGIMITGIPVEEFVFYITGFWFIIYLYIFCDEWFLLKYNPPDAVYARYASRLRRLIFIHKSSIVQALVLIVGGIILKNLINPQGSPVPGYFIFLVIVAYVPSILFFRLTKRFINWRAFFFTLLITALCSVIWEVTLALPRGYWDYQHGQMLGIFIPVWHNLPLEAVTVWIFCMLVVLLYEFLKISYFTDPAKRKKKAVKKSQ